MSTNTNLFTVKAGVKVSMIGNTLFDCLTNGMGF